VAGKGSELRTLIQAVIGPLCPDAARLQIRGAAVTLSSSATTSFALIPHELATNAVKYGASQSSGQGRIDVAWQTENDQLHFQWRETGTPIFPPKRKGFGTTVISKSLSGAGVEHLFHPEGVECTMRLHLTA
jgi:two-component sensor histidine kinase